MEQRAKILGEYQRRVSSIRRRLPSLPIPTNTSNHRAWANKLQRNIEQLQELLFVARQVHLLIKTTSHNRRLLKNMNERLENLRKAQQIHHRLALQRNLHRQLMSELIRKPSRLRKTPRAPSHTLIVTRELGTTKPYVSRRHVL